MAGLLCIVLGAFHFRAYVENKKQLAEENARRLSVATEVVKNGLVTLMLEGKGKDFGEFISDVTTGDLKSMRLISPGGMVVSSTLDGENNLRIKNLPLKASTFKDPDGIPYEVFMPIYNERPCQRCHSADGQIISVLNVELADKRTHAKIKEMRLYTGLKFLLNFLAIFGPIWCINSKVIATPLKDISGNLKKALRGEKNIMFKPAVSEIGEISSDLNKVMGQMGQMREKLEACYTDTMKRMEKMASLGELAAAIAHEIKNPLAGISGAIQVFVEDIKENDPRREIIKEILSEIDRLDQSIKNLLNFANPPALITIKTDIIPVIERARKLVAKQAESQGVSIIMPYENPEVQPVEVDPEQMQQVFLNVMLNALHSMPSGGMLTVNVYPGEDKNIEITISDTGAGIPPEAVESIFKPFFTTKRSGTGLGLAISKGIVEKHGGYISAESQPGLGSTFHVILPLRVKVASDGQG
ncbi:MAG: ATP-binding protein [Actinomycetota bacterium]|nr:ATP-binding protein [Actinomycetota bacterium]